MLKLSVLVLAWLTVCFVDNHENHHFEQEHDHDHDQETPYYKYSREANEPQASASRKATTYDYVTDRLLLYFSKFPYAELVLTAIPQCKFTRLWLHAIGSTLLISIAPFVLLFFIPLSGGALEQNQPLLKPLLAFASGSLLGDAFLHLIPHAYTARTDPSHHHGHQGHSHYHNHSGGHEGHDLSKVVRVINNKVGDGHSHHSHGRTSEKLQEKQLETSAKDQTSSDDDSAMNGAQGKAKLPVLERSLDRRIAGYLNLAADFAHNFTDGLAVGASYLAGNAVGAVTTFTVLLHEVPHEIGDFAILIQSGCSKTKAILLQLVTAVGALLGCCVSLLSANAVEISEAASHSWVLPFTAGGFIYIATVSIIPELLEDCGVWMSMKQLMAMLFGVYMMVLISELE
uniref:Uncharacterized protein n=1 Tax=Trichuris muris TaxID=70415 RepID=A0A5S6R0E5_TRIMR